MRGNFYDPESGSSSGATHVPDRNSTVLSPRTLPRCDSGLPRNSPELYGYYWETFLHDHLLKKDYLPQSSTIQRISASTSQKLRADTTDTARRESGTKREWLNALSRSRHFECGSGMLNCSGGTCSHGGMIDHPRFPIWELHLAKIS